MSRYFRKAYNVILVVSLLLLAATCVLWIWSYNTPWTRSILLAGRHGPNGGIEDETEMGWNVTSSRGVLHFEPSYSFYYWDTPYWKLFVLWFVLPARHLIPGHLLNRRERRISSGLCPNCGYDLRATRDRCPECGATSTPKELV